VREYTCAVGGCPLRAELTLDMLPYNCAVGGRPLRAELALDMLPYTYAVGGRPLRSELTLDMLPYTCAVGGRPLRAELTLDLLPYTCTVGGCPLRAELTHDILPYTCAVSGLPIFFCELRNRISSLRLCSRSCGWKSSGLITCADCTSRSRYLGPVREVTSSTRRHSKHTWRQSSVQLEFITNGWKHWRLEGLLIGSTST